MEAIVELLQILNSLSPLAVIALLGTVIFLLVKGKTSVDEKVEHVAGNHLSCLPEMNDTLKRIETALGDVKDNTIWLKAKINGHGDRQ